MKTYSRVYNFPKTYSYSSLTYYNKRQKKAEIEIDDDPVVVERSPMFIGTGKWCYREDFILLVLVSPRFVIRVIFIKISKRK